MNTLLAEIVENILPVLSRRKKKITTFSSPERDKKVIAFPFKIRYKVITGW
ncbi:hypothetical protein NLC35_03715 [Candidatus Aminicenantes bacterium AC-334-K16]|jgi:hypothetical protein|nr:hypothetical protein [Candidatus Aminicenantes bacterium AC-334-K16]